ncbi:MAG TPA: winged helix-turn-helix domain-containing protein [Pyrinomonadaceae bacterium]|nr:winged helix-turn-helix domain-containing protein [Pyrinomonadaceae bacterium]
MTEQVLKVYDFGPFRLDATVRHLLRDGHPLSLTSKVFDLLLLLVKKHGQLVTKEELMEELWPDSFVVQNNLTVHMSMLRKILGEGRRDHNYVETVPGRGYRFVARVREVDAESASEFRGATRYPAGKGAGQKDERLISIAVLPFVNNSNGPNLDYLSEGLTESIINMLSQIPHLRVMARSTVFFYKEKGASPVEAGREMKVQAVLTGIMCLSEEQLRIGIELVDVADGARIWGEVYERRASNILALQEEIAQRVAEKLQITLTSEEERQLTKRYSGNIAAHHLYLKGRYFWNKRTVEGFQKGLEYFQLAIAQDANHALAYVGLADCYNMLYSYNSLPLSECGPKVKEALEHAIAIDGDLAEAHASLGHVKMTHDWDWAGAGTELQLAISLNPNYATAHHWYSIYLRIMGRFDEALEEIELAQELDPLSPLINAAVGGHFYHTRQYEQAIAKCQEALELDPGFSIARALLGACYAEQGRYDEAIASLHDAIALANDPEAIAMLGSIHARAGQTGQARETLKRLTRLSKKRYVSPFHFALVHANLLDKDQAFQWLEKAWAERYEQLGALHLYPLLDTLHTDTRFTDLLVRIGLAPKESRSARFG